MMYPHATKFSPRAIINYSGDNFLNFHKISNLKMNTTIVFFFFFCESIGLKELHIKYLEKKQFRLSEKCKTKHCLLQDR